MAIVPWPILTFMERPVIKRFQALPPAQAVLVVVILFCSSPPSTRPPARSSPSRCSTSFRWLWSHSDGGVQQDRWRQRSPRLAWLAIDLGSGTTYSNPLIPFWNATVRFGFFSLFSFVLDRLQGAARAPDNSGPHGLLDRPPEPACLRGAGSSRACPGQSTEIRPSLWP